MNIVDFLRARLDEDEQTAREAAGAPWVVADASRTVHVDPEAQRDAQWQWGDMGYVATVAHGYDRAHIARHDPARVLREVEAKRELVSRYEAMEAGVLVVTGVESILSEYRRVILPQMALPYADHPDFREEWGRE